LEHFIQVVVILPVEVIDLQFFGIGKDVIVIQTIRELESRKRFTREYQFTVKVVEERKIYIVCKLEACVVNSLLDICGEVS